jgi:polar amino acid transport system ATP-binding protein
MNTPPGAKLILKAAGEIVEPFLRIERLNKRYEAEHALKDVSFSIRKGEVVVVVGPSGCGKSTLLRCINGLENIQSGEIILEGKSLSEGNPDWRVIRQKVGMVFQSYELFPHKTVLENLVLAPIRVQKRRRVEAVKAAETILMRVGLLEKRDAYPRRLSGGQKQRAAIARAIMMNPEIMLFDEVTAALDPEMVREVLDVLLTLAREGMTMLIVTHEMEFARAVADRILFFDEGVLLEENTPGGFFTTPRTERARRFLNLFQFEKIETHKKHLEETV